MEDKMRPLVAQELGRSTQYLPNQNELTVHLKNGRLEIAAHVDKDGLRELIAMLQHYQEILAKLGEWNRHG